MIALLALLLASAQEEGTLRVSWGQPAHLDPHRATSLAESRLLGALFDGLVAPGADGVTPEPGVAEKWESDAGGLEWVFTLREARWSNGDAVTAADFAAAWRRALRPGTGCEFRSLFRLFRNAGAWMDGEEADGLLAVYDDLPASAQEDAARRLGQVGRKRHEAALRRRGRLEAADAAAKRPDVAEGDLGFSAEGPRRLKVTLEHRAPWLPDLLTFMSFAPLHASTVADGGEGWTRPGRIVTNGPYLLDAVGAGELTLRRNPGYWDGAAAGRPEKIAVHFGTAEAAVRMFREGKLHWVTREQIPDDAGDLPGLVRFATWGTRFLRLNASRPPFDRQGIRAAFARSIDRAALKGVPAERLVPAGFRGYPEVHGVKPDRAAAMEALLRATGYDTSKFPRAEILTSDAPGQAALGEALRAQFEKVLGVTIRVRSMKWPAYMAALSTGAYEMALGGWMGDYYDPDAFLEGWTSGHGTGWSSPEFNALLHAASEETDGAVRLSRLAKAEALLLDEAPVIPLLSTDDAWLLSDRVAGVAPNHMSRVSAKHLRLTR